MHTKIVTVKIQADFFENKPSEKEIQDWVSSLNNALTAGGLMSEPQILPDSVEVQTGDLSRHTMIGEIKRIISEWGSFSVGEVQADCSPCVQSIGDSTVFLAEGFYDDHVEVQAYHDADGVAVVGEEYEDSYENLPYDTIESTYKLALQWEENQGQ